jgi:hypothetical protein
MPLQETSGNATTDAYGGGVAAVPNYIESVFSTYLWTGNGTSQTINNGIDLAGKGGLQWFKSRSGGSIGGAYSHYLWDTARGTSSALLTNDTRAAITPFTDGLTSFNSNGYSIGSSGAVNESSTNYVGWTFRKQPKFFDIVTYTGDGTNNRAISHSLGSAPGFIIIKNVTNAQSWLCYHRSIGVGNYIILNSTGGSGADSNAFPSVTSTTFVPTANESLFSLNASGNTYVAYIFAHNAGGFGLTGTDNVISCGSYTGNGSSAGPIVTLGYEPQWLLVKDTTAGVQDWVIQDVMRGMTVTAGNGVYLKANTADADLGNSYFTPLATGFQVNQTSAQANASGRTYIYIAIRRGPMKVPTSGTSVFAPALYTGTGSNNNITSPFPVDLLLVPNRAGQFYSPSAWDRLRGATNFLRTPGTDAEAVSSDGLTSFGAAQNSVAVGADATYGNINFSGRNYVPYSFRRSPSFFDEVCYTGNGVNARAITHNLGVAPEMIIVKKRTGADGWVVWASGLTSRLYELYLNDTRAQFVEASPRLNVNNAPTSTQFEVGTDGEVNASGATYVSYLFATCAGVSKVGSYIGNGSTQTINCGFTGGARFVLIKRTDAAGDWYVYDTARGMTTLTDPYLLLNSTAAESATLGSVTTVSTGFAVNASILAAINTNAASYIFLAIA